MSRAWSNELRPLSKLLHVPSLHVSLRAAYYHQVRPQLDLLIPTNKVTMEHPQIIQLPNRNALLPQDVVCRGNVEEETAKA